MGCSASCKIFEAFSSALQWIAINKCHIDKITHILDDFFMVNADKDACQSDLNRFLHVCDMINVPMAREKTLGPETVMTFMGYEIDSEKMEVRLPADKIAKCIQSIENLLERSRCTLKELQSLIGLLNFTCAVIIPGRAFLRRLIDLTIGVKKSWYSIRLDKEHKEDLKLWLKFFVQYNGKNLFHKEMFFTPELIHIYTDAAQNFGYAALFGTHFLYSAWPSSWYGKQNITFLELIPVVLAIETWGLHMRNAYVELHTDNEALVYIINKQTSKDKLIMVFIRRLVNATLRHNIMCQAVHIPGRINNLADALSRLQVEKFRQLHPTADKSPTEHAPLQHMINL